MAGGALTIAPVRNLGSKRWMGQKVLWFVHADYRGPVVIRGRQLDGPYAFASIAGRCHARAADRPEPVGFLAGSAAGRARPPVVHSGPGA
jgi:hypothetical protein